MSEIIDLIYPIFALIGFGTTVYFIFYKCREIKIEKIIRKAQEYGVYDGIWLCRNKFKVERERRSVETHNFSYYLIKLSDFNSGKFVTYLSEKELYYLLKHKKKDVPIWVIAYPNSQPARLVVNNNNK